MISLGFKVWQSQTNHLLAETPLSLPCSALEIYEALKTRGILIRYFDTPELEDKLRITVGTPDENAQLLANLAEILSAKSE